MRILENEPLNKYTSIRIGGTARKMYIPENREELTDIVRNGGSELYFLGGGTNLLIRDRIFDEVINLRHFDSSIRDLENGNFYIGASARNQDVIKHLNDIGYGGIEYLWSVPGLIGGAIVMNAGGSVKEGNSISDYIVTVTVLHNGSVEVLSKDACAFGHRNSLFKNDTDYVVLGGEFCFDRGSSEEFAEKRTKRAELCRQYQDASKPNFGSVFSSNNMRIMELLRRISFGKKKGVHFSNKTRNWLVNEGEGTFAQADKLIKTVGRLHRFVRRSCTLEVIVWR